MMEINSEIDSQKKWPMILETIKPYLMFFCVGEIPILIIFLYGTDYWYFVVRVSIFWSSMIFLMYLCRDPLTEGQSMYYPNPLPNEPDIRRKKKTQWRPSKHYRHLFDTSAKKRNTKKKTIPTSKKKSIHPNLGSKNIQYRHWHKKARKYNKKRRKKVKKEKKEISKILKNQKKKFHPETSQLDQIKKMICNCLQSRVSFSFRHHKDRIWFTPYYSGRNFQGKAVAVGIIYQIQETDRITKPIRTSYSEFVLSEIEILTIEMDFHYVMKGMPDPVKPSLRKIEHHI